MTQANDILSPHYIDYGADDRGYTHDGLTKREYFAAMAMQGVIAQRSYFELSLVAEKAIQYADALIKELNKTT